MGPGLLARVLELNDTQAGVLESPQLADDQGLLLLDMDDLRALLAFVADNRNEIMEAVRSGQHPNPWAAIQRSLLTLEREGGTSCSANRPWK